VRHGHILSHVEPIRPIVTRLTSLIEELGDDVIVEREPAYVAFSRGERFAVLEPASATRLDVRLALPGTEETERLRPAQGFGTHMVSLAHEDEIDGELTAWLRGAYNAAST
jgi:uncharacterized protein DUF5655